MAVPADGLERVLLTWSGRVGSCRVRGGYLNYMRNLSGVGRRELVRSRADGMRTSINYMVACDYSPYMMVCMVVFFVKLS